MKVLIEQLIYKALKDDVGIIDCMATYDGQPAIFYREAPQDTDPGWYEGKCFPRADFNVCWSYDEEHKKVCKMVLNVWCLNESGPYPEDIGNVFTKNMSDLILAEEDGVYCTVWSSTESFEGTSVEPKTVGVTITFEILNFPDYRTFEPDPVVAVQSHIKRLIPDCLIIWNDEMQEHYKPENERPVVYVRMSCEPTMTSATYSVSWYKCTMTIHLMAPDFRERQRWLQVLIRGLSSESGALMTDQSFITYTKMSHNVSADPLCTGQITLTASYGVLNDHPEHERLNHIHY